MIPTALSLAGMRVPHVTLKTRRHHHWHDVATGAFFAGRTVVVFSLPGAFTPTCSGSHVPRYAELAASLQARGVDEVVCMAVNDAFVMNEWQLALQADNLTFLPDGNGAFTAGMGLLVDKEKIGLGHRSWRYSMLVRDGVVEKAFVEADTDDDPLLVSDADTMLHYLDPGAVAPEPVVVFALPGCPHCARAKALLTANGYRFDEITAGKGVTASTLRAVSGASTWPQVFIGGKRVGSADDLAVYLDRHKTK